MSIRANKIRQTFTLPELVFKRFAALVPEGSRSAVITKLIQAEATRREHMLARACDQANKNVSAAAAEGDFQALLEDTVIEPWDTNAHGYCRGQ